MHDGGGNRSGTLAALPGIIDTLRARGYGFATVSELLGHRILYRPYG
jgi:peptidoglycan/xylan/chitin deacetylase (PgdA/CDA1 family)